MSGFPEGQRHTTDRNINADSSPSLPLFSFSLIAAPLLNARRKIPSSYPTPVLSHCSSSTECQLQNPFLTPHTSSPLLLPWPFLSSHLSATCVGADMSPLFLFFSLTPPNCFDPCMWVEGGCTAPWGHSNKLPNTGCLKTT